MIKKRQRYPKEAMNKGITIRSIKDNELNMYLNVEVLEIELMIKQITGV